MDYLKFKGKINDMAKVIAYPCKKTDHLAYAVKLSTTPGHLFFHSGFETVGKSLLNSINTHYLFTRGYCTEKEITKAMETYLKDDPYGKYAREHALKDYVYNDKFFASEDKDNTLKLGDVDATIVYRIIGAMYYDSDWQTVKHWVINTLGIRKMKKTGSIQSGD